MIVVLDLGIGNISSVRSGFGRVGGDTVVVANGAEWNELIRRDPNVSGIVLPGVGAFGDAMFQLRTSGLLQVVRQAARDGRPILGICLGMQLLFSMSEEHGTHMGLGFFPGKVVRFTGEGKIPHMGWNELSQVADHPLLAGVHKGDFVYFVHSYYAQVQEPRHVLAATDYLGVTVPAIVGKQSIFGAQFHPEKSGPVGERIVENFVRFCYTWSNSEEAATIEPESV